MRLGIVASHPVQYYAPLYQYLARRVKVRVWFGYVPDARSQGRDFGVEFQWDVPLREGYESGVFAQELEKEFSAWGCIRAAARLRMEWREWKPDAVLFSGWSHRSLLVALAASIALRAPRLLRHDSNLLRRRKPWAHSWHRFVLRLFCRGLPVGRLNRDYYLHYGMPPDRLVDSPHFVENERFRASVAGVVRGPGRAALGIPETACVFVFCGKLQRKKHPEIVLEALKILSAESAHALFIGDGELRNELQRSARGLPVVFAGFVNQSMMPHTLALADVLVLPSDEGETWGLVVNEAMACGLPAIVSDRVGCSPDLVSEGNTGFVFPFGDARALAERMRFFVENPEKPRELGQNAARRVGLYSVEAAGEGILRAAEDCLKRREGGLKS